VPHREAAQLIVTADRSEPAALRAAAWKAPLLGVALICVLVCLGPSFAEAATTQPCGTSSTPPTVEHVVWVVFENKNYGSIIGSPSAPFINTLADQCGLATNFFAERHPSLPNYIAMTSGSTQGITDNGGPSSHPLAVPSIFSQLGLDWSSLQESMPSSCLRSDSGLYAVRHNPAAYYTNLDCAAGDVPLISPLDLSASFTFVTPNLCNDMHDCSVATGDAWLSAFMLDVLASSEYQAGRTVVFITWDESSDNSLHIPTLVVSPSTPGGTRVGDRYDHYSMLRTTEELLGLNPLGNAATAPSMASPFNLRASSLRFPQDRLWIPLVPASRACTSANREHGPPLVFPACSPPRQASAYLTVGTPDANGESANSVGHVELDAVHGDPTTQASEADIEIETRLTDVRRRSDLTDYAGGIQTMLDIRLTELADNTTHEPQTVEDLPFRVTVPCAKNDDTTVGSTCALTTTADTVLPGAVTEQKQSIWQFRSVRVYDGGSDGNAGTANDNTLFETEGVFVP
jgi:phosphatidylinositol-3-phosphatase